MSGIEFMASEGYVSDWAIGLNKSRSWCDSCKKFCPEVIVIETNGEYHCYVCVECMTEVMKGN